MYRIKTPPKVKIKVKIVGALPPHPRELFVKSSIKNFEMGDLLKSALVQNPQVKVLIKLFQKFAGFGAEPQGLGLALDLNLLTLP